MATWTATTKNTSSFSAESKTSEDATWAETDPTTWENAEGSWNQHQFWFAGTKNTASWTGETKN